MSREFKILLQGLGIIFGIWLLMVLVVVVFT